MSIEKFNLDDFRLKPSLQGTPAVTKLVQTTSTSSQSGEAWFLKGPIPGAWLAIASALSGKALHVGLAIWYQIGLTKHDQIKVTTKTRKKFSLKRDAYHRGLKELENVGLIKVKRMPGACADITILSASQNSP
jgi:hypothetical protein